MYSYLYLSVNRSAGDRMCKNLKTTFGVLASVCSVCPQLWCVGFILLCLSPALVCWLQSALSVPTFDVLASVCSVCPHIWCVGFSLLCLSPHLVCWLQSALSVPNFGVLALTCSLCPQRWYVGFSLLCLSPAYCRVQKSWQSASP